MVAITHPGIRPDIRPSAVGVRPVSAAVYRRRRVAVLGALLVLVALLSIAVQLVVGAARPSGIDGVRPVAHVSVTVGPGDTVWSIASGLAPDTDPRPVVDAIVAANGGSTLVVGERLDIVLP